MTTDTIEQIELWSARRVAEELGFSVSAVWRYARLGRLPAPIPIDGCGWIYVWNASDVRRWKAQHA